MANKDYNEIWLEAMDLLIHNRLATLTYDKTIKCKVIELKAEKIYQVEEESSLRYTAQVLSDSTYNPGDMVYVLVPNGDYSAQKIILGKCKVEDVNSPINYISPLGTMLPNTNSITTDIAGSIATNGSESLVELTPPIDLTTKADEFKYNYTYDTIGLSADFKTLFSNIDMLEGNYGIMLELTTDDDSTHIALLDSSDMFGDPYNYMTFFKQSYKFDISQLGNIKMIKVFLYQQGNFKYATKQGVTAVHQPKYIDGIQVRDICVANVEILLGEDLIKIADNTFKLTVHGDQETVMSYNPGDEKKIFATWYNKSDDHEIIGFKDGVVDETYDEDTYQHTLETEWAGAMMTSAPDVPPLRETLQLYSNAKEIQNLLNFLYNKSGDDVLDVVNNMNTFLGKFEIAPNESIVEKLTEYLNASRVTVGKGDDNYNGWYKEYIDYLSKCNETFNTLKETPDQAAAFTEGVSGDVSVSKLINPWNIFDSNMNAWFTSLETTPEGEDQLGDIRAYVSRQQRLYAQCVRDMNKWHTKLSELVNANATLMPKINARLSVGTLDLTTFSEEYKKFADDNANKYCIYWYRRDWESEGDKWSGAGWTRVQFIPISSTAGMPNVVDGEYEARSLRFYPMLMNENLAEDEVKAILFFNHTRFNSNTLTFKNLQPPSNAGVGDPEDSIHIEHGRNSQDSYQKYSSIFTLINGAEGMINRELRVRYVPINTEITEAQALENTNVFWYIPNQSSMLRYDITKLNNVGLTQLSKFLQNADETTKTAYANYVRPGYECFFRAIVDPEKDTLFYYMIQNMYQPAAALNTIYCIVEKDESKYEAEVPFVFSTYGTSGTQYTLSVVPVGVQTAIEELDEETRRPLYLEVRFTGFEGATIEEIPAVDLDWQVGTTAKNWTPNITVLSDEDCAELGIEQRPGSIYCELSKDVSLGTTSEIKELYTVLTAAVHWEKIDDETDADQKLTLQTYYPVAQTIGPYYLDGPTTVIYDSQGTNPNYIHKPYRLFKTSDNTEVQNIGWVIRRFNNKGEPMTSIEASLEAYLPRLEYIDKISYAYPEVGWYLRPLSMYVSNVGVYSVIMAYDAEGNVVYSQPLYEGQNTWESSLLNSWNEGLTIDEENGIILSAMMGAGFKDNENRFHGVLMGDVGSKTNVETGSRTGVGLYGFHEGAQSFGFDVDGSAFIGKAGKGRIHFDGNHGQITSESFSKDGENEMAAGMRIDLDDGVLEMRGAAKNADGSYSPDGTQSYIKLDVKSPYLTIDSESGKTLMSIGKEEDKMFIQSNDYEENKKGFYINLNNGHINAYNFKLVSKNVLLDAGEDARNYLIVKDDCVDEEGNANPCTLISIGADGFYLQTCKYLLPTFTDGVITAPGNGFRFDLQTGTINANNFTLTGYATDEAHLGSYIQMTSEPSLHLKARYKETIGETEFDHDIDLLKIKGDEYCLHSRSWMDGTQSATDTKTETGIFITLKSGITSLNVRKGPSTSYATTGLRGAITTGETVRVYNVTSPTDMPDEGWYSLNPTNSIGASDSMWTSAYWNSSHAWNVVQDTVTTSSTTFAMRGMEIDMSDGRIRMHRGSTEQQVLINSSAETYPLQIGKSADGGRRAFNVSWDGGIYGGTNENKQWSISPDGTVSFKSGSLSSVSAYAMYASNITLSGGVTYGNANYAPQSMEFTALVAFDGENPGVVTGVGIPELVRSDWQAVYKNKNANANEIVGYIRGYTINSAPRVSKLHFGTVKVEGSYFSNGLKITTTNAYTSGSTVGGGGGGSSAPPVSGGNIGNKPTVDFMG